MVTARLGLPFSLVGMGYRDEDCVRLARWDVSSTEKTDSDCGVVDCGAVDCDAEDGRCSGPLCGDLAKCGFLPRCLEFGIKDVFEGLER